MTHHKLLSIIAVPLLAAPSAYGVYMYLEPESGIAAAVSAAIGFELAYIGVNVLALHTPEQRQYAQRVALAAVATAVIFNTLAHYQLKVPGAFTGASLSWLALSLSLLTALPLAGLAYALSVLLHRLSEHESSMTQRQRDDSTALSTMLSSPPVQNTVNILVESDSKSNRVKQLAAQHGVSESTMWRRVKRQPELLEE